MDEQENINYLNQNVQPMLKSLTITVLINKPLSLVNYMISWLKQNMNQIPQVEITKEFQKNQIKHKQYIQKYLDPVLQSFIVEILMQKPSGNKVVQFFIDWLTENKSQFVNEEHPESEEENDYDEVDEAEIKRKKNTKQNRQGVSAEVFGEHNQKENFKPRNIPKKPEQIQRIVQRLQQAFMFAGLDENEKEIVIGTLEERAFKQGEYVIQQGNDGAELFIVDSGKLDCTRVMAPGQQPTYLKTYQQGESFGELALLYNVPRAASIQAKSDSVCWVLDRDTFNNVVKDSSMKKRQKYEEFLKQVKIFQEMEEYERNQLTDALQEATFKAGDMVFEQGEEGNIFYMIKEGELIAIKDGKQVFKYEKIGDYFGELALMNNKPRAASIQCLTDCKLVTMDRLSFKRLLGPLDEILKRNQELYKQYLNK